MSAVPPPSTSERGRLEELYQSVILDHNRRPRNFREIADADGRAEGRNPNCGDRVIVWLRLEGDTVADVSFKVPPGEGCAISRASASLMTTAVKGKRVEDAEAMFGRFIELLTVQRRTPATGSATVAAGPADVKSPERSVGTGEMGTLEVFSGVSRFPQRVKCATMAWHALHSALQEAVGSARGA